MSPLINKISTKILSIDAENKKISMGTKQLQDNPWETIESKYPVGSDHEGIVRNLTQFGAFVELEEGVEGLIHISEMSWIRHIKHPSDIFQSGETISAKILNIDSDA